MVTLECLFRSVRIAVGQVVSTPLSGLFFFFQAEDGIRDYKVTGVQTCALPISIPAACLAPGKRPGAGTGRRAASLRRCRAVRCLPGGPGLRPVPRQPTRTGADRKSVV